MKKHILIFLLIIHFNGYSQIGIGTTNPTAQLEIVAPSTGIPSLELSPQSLPIGTANGQIAVIGDKLYMYDLTRVKWLSVEATSLQFGYDGSSDGQVLLTGGDVTDSDSGAKMPFNGTIVYVTVQSSGGNTNKRFYLRLNGSNIATNANPNLSGRFNLSGGAYTSTSYNINFNAGDYLSTRSSSSGSSVSDPVVIIWIKWRK